MTFHLTCKAAIRPFLQNYSYFTSRGTVAENSTIELLPSSGASSTGDNLFNALDSQEKNRSPLNFKINA